MYISRIIFLAIVFTACTGKSPHEGHVQESPAQPESYSLMLSDSQMRLANVVTQPVSVMPIGETLVVNGRIAVNESLRSSISSRVGGRIEKLYIKEAGQSVRQGEPLYSIYSEALQTYQKEYLLALAQYSELGTHGNRYQSFLEAAERKLLLYGMTKQQVKNLEQSQQVSATTLFLSPASGVVGELSISEGQYVEEGTLLYSLEGLSDVWVEAELFPSESSLAKVGDRVMVAVNGAEESLIEGKVTFLSPEFRSGTQIQVMRAVIANPDMKYKPGMQARVSFKHSERKGVVVPVDALIRDESGAHVYVQQGKNTFRPQLVSTGHEAFDKIEITNGLSSRDTIAVSGAYLLYSEIVLKKGIDPASNHSHTR